MIVDQKFTIVVQSTLLTCSWSQSISPAVLSQKSGAWGSFLEIVVRCQVEEVARAGRQGVETVEEAVVVQVVEEAVVGEVVEETAEEVVEEPVEDLVEDCSVKETPVWQKVRNGSTYLHTQRKSIH